MSTPLGLLLLFQNEAGVVPPPNPVAAVAAEQYTRWVEVKSWYQDPVRPRGLKDRREW